MRELDAFLAELSGLSGSSTNTVRSYRQHVSAFLDFITSKHIQIDAVRRENMLEWSRTMDERKLMPRSKAVAVAAVRRFFGWMVETERLASSPVPPSMTVKVKKQEAKDVPDAQTFLAWRAQLETFSLVQAAAIELMAGSGLRVGALTTLTRQHLHLDGPRPHVLVDTAMACKGCMAGEIPVTPAAASSLRKFLATATAPKNGPIFNMSEQAVRNWCSKLSDSLHPHALRHFYCAMMYYKNLDGGRHDAVWVRDAAGHSSIAVTDNYLRMSRRVVADDASWHAVVHGRPMAESLAAA